MGLSTALIKTLPDSFIESAGRRYLAGNNLVEGIDNICRLYEQFGYFASFDIVGEDASTTAEANDTVNYYLEAIDMIAKRFDFGKHSHQKPVSISVKPSAICLVYKKPDKVVFDSKTPLQQQLGLIAKVAGDKGIDITLDMEDHRYTDQSLEALRSLWSAGYNNLGGVLQSSLNRTEADLWRIAEKAASERRGLVPRIHRAALGESYRARRIRLCRGIYSEPKEIATPSKKEAKSRLCKEVGILLDYDLYLEIATHDQKLIQEIEINHLWGRDKTKSEFQFLLGVPVAEKVLAPRLFQEGYTVRFYTPVKIRDNGTKYMRRRLIESPGMVLDGVCASLLGGKPLVERLDKKNYLGQIIIPSPSE